MIGFGEDEIRTLDTGKTVSLTTGKTEKTAVSSTEALAVAGTMSDVAKVTDTFASAKC